MKILNQHNINYKQRNSNELLISAFARDIIPVEAGNFLIMLNDKFKIQVVEPIILAGYRGEFKLFCESLPEYQSLRSELQDIKSRLSKIQHPLFQEDFQEDVSLSLDTIEVFKLIKRDFHLSLPYPKWRLSLIFKRLFIIKKHFLLNQA